MAINNINLRLHDIKSIIEQNNPSFSHTEYHFEHHSTPVIHC